MGSFLVYGGTLEPYLREFGVDKLEMASVIGIYAGLVCPRSALGGPCAQIMLLAAARSTFR